MVGLLLFQGNYNIVCCFLFSSFFNSNLNRYIEIEQEKLVEFNNQLDWLKNGTYGYHMPRHGNLFTKFDFDRANKTTSLPMKIADYIFNLPFLY
jgi:hypothetical protein